MAALVLAGLLSSPAEATQVRYMLTATFTSERDSWDPFEYCGMATRHVPDGPGVPVLVCSYSDDNAHSSASYTVRSTRPFVFSRSAFKPPFFNLEAPVTGTFSRTLGSSSWAIFGDANGPPMFCNGGSSGSHSGRLTGTITMNGYTKARVKMHLRTLGTPSGSTSTHNECTGFPATNETTPAFGMADSAWLRFFDLRKPFGNEFTLSDTWVDTGLLRPPRERTVSHWRIHFTPVAAPRPAKRHWRIEISGFDTWSWGLFTGLRAGVNVEWTHVTDLVAEGDKVLSATGKVRVGNVTPFSQPTGAFGVTYKATADREYKLRWAIKHGNRLTLNLFRDPGSFYRVRFSTAPAGPALLEQLRRINVPSPEASYQSVVDRGPVDDEARPITPYPSRIVLVLNKPRQRRETESYNDQLPCTKFKAKEADCFRSRGGQLVTVTELK